MTSDFFYIPEYSGIHTTIKFDDIETINEWKNLGLLKHSRYDENSIIYNINHDIFNHIIENNTSENKINEEKVRELHFLLAKLLLEGKNCLISRQVGWYDDIEWVHPKNMVSKIEIELLPFLMLKREIKTVYKVEMFELNFTKDSVLNHIKKIYVDKKLRIVFNNDIGNIISKY